MFNIIKEQRDLQTRQLIGYQADGMFIPLDKANSDYQKVQEYIANGGTVEPAFTLDDEKQFKLQELKNSYTDELNTTIAYKDSTYQADTNSYNEMIKVLSTLPDSSTVLWYDIDNKAVELTKKDLLKLSYSITERNQVLFNKLQKLKKLVKESDNIDKLKNVIW